MAEKKSMYYNDYLQLNKILDAQHPESFKGAMNRRMMKCFYYYSPGV